MAPVNGGGGNGNGNAGPQQPQTNVVKKTNNKGVGGAMPKRKIVDEAAQRRMGCPVLLESGCRVGEPVDSAKPGDAVKMNCQNPKCDYSPFIHRRCYDEWEDLLVTVMATTSWSRSWTDAQRRSNLWDKKGYQLIGKMCRCLCDKGHVRRDLDYKPPVAEDAAKKKLKKPQINKNLPTLKNPDFKAGFIGKQLPNATGSGTTSGVPTTTTTFVNRTLTVKRRNIYQQSGSSISSPMEISLCGDLEQRRKLENGRDGHWSPSHSIVFENTTPSEDRFAGSSQSRTSNERGGNGNGNGGVAESNQYSMSSISAPFRCASTSGGLRDREFLDARSPSSGFEEESVGSIKSEHELRVDDNESAGTRYFAPSSLQYRDSSNGEFWQSDPPCDYLNRSLQFYNSSASAHFIPPPSFSAGYVRPFWQATPSLSTPQPSVLPPPQPVYYYRDYQLFDGNSFEDGFRRELPIIYNGTGRCFESINLGCDHQYSSINFNFASG